MEPTSSDVPSDCDARNSLRMEYSKPLGQRNEFCKGLCFGLFHDHLTVCLYRAFGRSNPGATSLLVLPRMTSSKTCRSRGVNFATMRREGGRWRFLQPMTLRAAPMPD